MPSIAAKASVLEGRAEVVSYTRDASAFFLRVRIKEKAGYKSRRIDGVESLDAAIDAARLQLEKAKMESQERIAGAKIGADAVNQQKELDAKEFMEGTKLGAEAVKQQKERNNTQT